MIRAQQLLYTRMLLVNIEILLIVDSKTTQMSRKRHVEKQPVLSLSTLRTHIEDYKPDAESRRLSKAM
jgi:hypothetical protein